jgi:hypothetical protein
MVGGASAGLHFYANRSELFFQKGTFPLAYKSVNLG